MRIEICGGIASGKTTLAQILGASERPVVFENFYSNPFWKLFYSDPGSYSFEAEITFLLQHYNQIKMAESERSVLVCDFSILLDLGYADVNLHGGAYSAFAAVYREVQMRLGDPSFLVLLTCSPKEELHRIVNRGRSEESKIDTGYLAALNQAVEKRFNESRTRVPHIEIDSEAYDFANIDEIKNQVVDQILKNVNATIL